MKKTGVQKSRETVPLRSEVCRNPVDGVAHFNATGHSYTVHTVHTYTWGEGIITTSAPYVHKQSA